MSFGRKRKQFPTEIYSAGQGVLRRVWSEYVVWPATPLQLYMVIGHDKKLGLMGQTRFGAHCGTPPMTT